MKGYFQKALICFISLSILVLPIISCEKSSETVAETNAVSPVQKDDVIKDITDLTPLSQPGFQEGIITFYTGEVTVQEQGQWYYVEIGDAVRETNTIKVGSDSYCEIQFGNTSMIRVQENSEVNLATINTKQGESSTTIDMKMGSVLCKVQKLASEESFRVKTQTAVCGVRGTEFAVTADSKNETMLAVKSGAVAVLPQSIDIDSLKARVAGRRAALNAIEKLEKDAPVVNANQEVAISEKTVAQSKAQAAEIETIVKEISASSAENQASIQKLETAVAAQQKTVSQTVTPVTMTQTHTTDVKPIDDMKMIPLSEKVSIHKVSVESVTDGASININGRYVGTNSFAGLFTENENVKVDIRKSGYKPYSFEFTVADVNANRYVVELEVLPQQQTTAPAASTAAPVVPATASTPAPAAVTEKTVAITAVPSDSQIFVNSRPVGKGKATVTHKVGERITVTASKDGYATKNETISVTANTPSAFSIRLEKQPIEATISAFSNPVVSRIAVSGTTLYAADSSGNLFSSELNGRNAKTIKTLNSPNANSAPVAIGSRVYFSGSKELVVADASTFAELNRKTLDSNSAHMFGRTVVQSGNKVIYPENNRLVLSTFEKGASEEKITLPVDSGMTPAIWNNQIVIVDIEGNVRIIDPAKKTVSATIPTNAIQPIALSMTISGNTGFFANRNGVVISVDLANKKVNWETKISDAKINVFTNLGIDSEKVFVFAGSKIFAYNIQTGKELYSLDSTCPPAIDRNTLYYATSGGNFIAANAQNGRTQNTISVKAGNIITKPEIANGKIVVGTSSGKIVVLNPAGF